MAFNNQFIRITCTIFALLFVINLIFIIHNLVRFIFGLRMKQNLILAFYSTILIGQIFRITEFSLRAVFPDRCFLPNLDFRILAAELLGSTASVAVELILIQTMLKLSLALRLLTGKIGHE